MLLFLIAAVPAKIDVFLLALGVMSTVLE